MSYFEATIVEASKFYINSQAFSNYVVLCFISCLAAFCILFISLIVLCVSVYRAEWHSPVDVQANDWKGPPGIQHSQATGRRGISDSLPAENRRGQPQGCSEPRQCIQVYGKRLY